MKRQSLPLIFLIFSELLLDSSVRREVHYHGQPTGAPIHPYLIGEEKYAIQTLSLSPKSLSQINVPRSR